MYKLEFLEYNHLMQQVMSEEDTLENIIDLYLNSKPSKEEKVYLTNVESWAKYAFEKNNGFYMVFYKESELFAFVKVNDMTISIDFLERTDLEIIKYLSIVYHRYNLSIYFKTDKKEYYPNNDLFLGQIEVRDKNKDSYSSIVFSPIKNRATVSLTITEPKKKDWKTVEQGIDINTTYNFIRSPKNYKDFEYLLDYQSNIKSEYFDLNYLKKEVNKSIFQSEKK